MDAIKLASQVYKSNALVGLPHLKELKVIKEPHVGELRFFVNCIEKDKCANSTGFFVFRGTDKQSLGEIFKNISIFSVLSILIPCLILAIGSYYLKEASNTKKINEVVSNDERCLCYCRYCSHCFNPLVTYFFCIKLFKSKIRNFVIKIAPFGIIFMSIFMIQHLSFFKDNANYVSSSNILMKELLGSNTIVDFLNNNNVKELFFSGHSKGGAEAALMYDKYRFELCNVKTHLITIGSAASTVEIDKRECHLKESDKKNGDKINFLFSTDSARFLNVNNYYGEVVEISRDESCYFILYLIFPFIMMAFLFHGFTYFICGNALKDSLRKRILVGGVVPVFIIVLHLIFTHPAKDYVDHIERIQLEKLKEKDSK